MKKLLILAGLTVSLVSHAAVYSEQSFLSGWNLYVTNNGSGQAVQAVAGNTNTLFTTLQGQIVFSLTNNTVNGVLNTNTIAADAFDGFNDLFADDAGDVVANGSIHYYVNQTNWIPVAVTNSQGQYFVTNTWPLFSSQYPTYMYPATTNLYPSLPNASATNLLTFNFKRGWKYNFGSSGIIVWDTSTNVFSFSVNGQGFSPFSGVTNLPTAFTQGAQLIKLDSVVAGTNSSAVSSGFIINQVSLGQWKP